jgi:hypothetical protein
MRTAILLVREHGKKVFELVHGPDVGITEQQTDVRELLASPREHEHFAEAQFWTSDGGLQRTVKFMSPEEAKAKALQTEKDEVAFKAEQERLAKRPVRVQAKPENKPQAKAPENTTPAPQTQQQQQQEQPAANSNAPQAPLTEKNQTQTGGDW